MPQQQGLVLTGDANADTLRGTGAMDVISGLNGADVLIGQGASDALSGGAGADILMEGNGDGILVADRTDALVDGGEGIDTVILGPGTTAYTFSTSNMKGIEAIQDAPGSHTTIVFDAGILASANDDSFLFALGDGTDEVRVINSTGMSMTVQNNEVVFGGDVVLRFEGVENLTVSGGDANNTSVVSQSLSPGQSSATAVHSFSSADGSTTVTSVTTGTTTGTFTTAGDNGAAVAGAGSAAETLAQVLFGSAVDTTDLTGLSKQLFDLLEEHAEAATALRAEIAAPAQASATGDLFSGSLFGSTGLLDFM